MMARLIGCLVVGVLVGARAFAADPTPNVLFVIGEREYNTRVTLPVFARRELAPLGYNCRFIHAASDDPEKQERHDFPGLVGALDEADLLVLSVRRRFLKPEELRRLRGWIKAGGPVVAIRTGSHAFAARSAKNVPPGRVAWQGFDREVLGARYRGHYNNKISEGKQATLAWVDEQARGHKLLEGVAWEGRRRVTSHLYKMQGLEDAATVLLRGVAPGQGRVEPIAWTCSRDPGRAFYTSLGSEQDLQDPAILRLLLNAIRWSLEEQTEHPRETGRQPREARTAMPNG